jgi:hypothetical protein
MLDPSGASVPTPTPAALSRAGEVTVGRRQAAVKRADEETMFRREVIIMLAAFGAMLVLSLLLALIGSRFLR